MLHMERVFKLNKGPVQFLLHVVNGYVDELEVFPADFSIIDKDFVIMDDDIVEIII